MCSLKICMFISFCPSLTPHNTAAQTGTDSKIHYGCASCTCPVLDTLSSNPFFPRSVCRVGAPGSAPAAPARTRWPLALSAFVRVGAVRVRCRRCSGFGRVARVRPQNQSLQRIFSNSFFFLRPCSPSSVSSDIRCSDVDSCCILAYEVDGEVFLVDLVDLS